MVSLRQTFCSARARLRIASRSFVESVTIKQRRTIWVPSLDLHSIHGGLTSGLLARQSVASWPCNWLRPAMKGPNREVQNDATSARTATRHILLVR
jgi:hypothetical protein